MVIHSFINSTGSGTTLGHTSDSSLVVLLASGTTISGVPVPGAVLQAFVSLTGTGTVPAIPFLLSSATTSSYWIIACVQSQVLYMVESRVDAVSGGAVNAIVIAARTNATLLTSTSELTSAVVLRAWQTGTTQPVASSPVDVGFGLASLGYSLQST